ncbi:MAG: hypothetical protein WAS36_02385 [Candidatus Saccharimonadales bacterium]
MKNLILTENIVVMAFASIFFWVLFIISLAWSVMRYNYAKIPHDITISSSIEAILIMGIIVSSIPFMIASCFTYRTSELIVSRKQGKQA